MLDNCSAPKGFVLQETASFTEEASRRTKNDKTERPGKKKEERNTINEDHMDSLSTAAELIAACVSA